MKRLNVWKNESVSGELAVSMWIFLLAKQVKKTSILTFQFLAAFFDQVWAKVINAGISKRYKYKYKVYKPVEVNGISKRTITAACNAFSNLVTDGRVGSQDPVLFSQFCKCMTGVPKAFMCVPNDECSGMTPARYDNRVYNRHVNVLLSKGNWNFIILLTCRTPFLPCSKTSCFLLSVHAGLELCLWNGR